MVLRSQAEVADLIRETRKLFSLTQTQLAQKLGVSYQSVNRWENGRNLPLPIVLKQIETLLQQQGDRGLDLFQKHFCDEL